MVGKPAQCADSQDGQQDQAGGAGEQLEAQLLHHDLQRALGKRENYVRPEVRRTAFFRLAAAGIRQGEQRQHGKQDAHGRSAGKQRAPVEMRHELSADEWC